jgi:hypothetical protein
MISGSTYREFVAPLDDALLACYPHKGMIHLCGAHSQHIPAFRDMPHLKALQLHNRAAADLGLYLEGLRKDQVLYVNVCEEMPARQVLKLPCEGRVILVGNIT